MILASLLYPHDPPDTLLKSISAMCGYIEDVLTAGEFDELNSEVNALDLNNIQTVKLVALLRYTSMAGDVLPSWSTWVDNTKGILEARKARGEFDIPVARLMRGLL